MDHRYSLWSLFSFHSWMLTDIAVYDRANKGRNIALLLFKDGNIVGDGCGRNHDHLVTITDDVEDKDDVERFIRIYYKYAQTRSQGPFFHDKDIRQWILTIKGDIGEIEPPLWYQRQSNWYKQRLEEYLESNFDIKKR